jgi:hypothetical protein
LDQHIGEALVALAIVIIGSIGTLITVLTDRIKRDLATNTQLTQETKTAANGTLTTALEKLAAERDLVVGLRELLQEREDRIAFIQSHHPEVAVTVQQYKRRRTSRAPDELAAVTGATTPLHVPPAYPDDPTGADAGAHPGG